MSWSRQNTHQNLVNHRFLVLAIPTRFERVTYRLGICCSILLSYGTVGRDV